VAITEYISLVFTLFRAEDSE